jgi:hypothetical protein
MGNIHKVLNPPEFDWLTERCVKSLKLFRNLLRTFSLRKFSSNSRILATIDVDKYTLDEFLTFTGDFIIKIIPTKEGDEEYWLKCSKNNIGLHYKTIFTEIFIEEYSNLYWKWDNEYFDHFKGLNFPERYAIIKEI